MPKPTESRNPRGSAGRIWQNHPGAEPMASRLLGMDPEDPAVGSVARLLFRAKRDGEDITDPHVIQRCVVAGRIDAEKNARRIAEARARYMERVYPNCVVYYLRVNGYIKIGTAQDLRVRLGSYPPGTELLAVESGSYDREKERLVEFAEYLAARKEWFRPGPRLMAHIDAIHDPDTLRAYLRTA